MTVGFSLMGLFFVSFQFIGLTRGRVLRSRGTNLDDRKLIGEALSSGSPAACAPGALWRVFGAKQYSCSRRSFPLRVWLGLGQTATACLWHRHGDLSGVSAGQPAHHRRHRPGAGHPDVIVTTHKNRWVRHQHVDILQRKRAGLKAKCQTGTFFYEKEGGGDEIPHGSTTGSGETPAAKGAS